MKQGDYLFWIWYSRRLGPGNIWARKLLEIFNTPYEIFGADAEALAEAIPDLPPREREALGNKSLDDAYRILRICAESGIGLLCYGERNFPLSLHSIANPPMLLYYRGTLPDFQNRLFLALVGTRKMSEYGRGISYKIAYELAAAGAIVVSGMALGNDSVAAGAAIAAGGETVAFLGCGVDVVYPKEHAALMEEIIRHGVVMSEYAPGTRPEGRNFPVRNRLISGLSQGTVILEAAEHSGAMITAECATVQGRNLFAVPANVGSPNASGVNQLIRDGVPAVLCAEDILREYDLLYRKAIALQSSHLGARSDYNPEVMARLGIYSRPVEGYTRIPAYERTGSWPGTEEAPKKAAPAPASQNSGEKRQPDSTTEVKPVSQSPAARRTAETSGESTAQKRTDLADQSSRVLAGMGERERKVFEAIPMDRPVSIDRLQGLGYSTGQLLTALSLLEINGLVLTLPGGLYSRA